MKKAQILSLILGGMLAVQNTAALAMTNSVYSADIYSTKLYAETKNEEPTHKEKAEILKKYGLITDDLLKDETKKATYSDAVRALAYFCWYSEDFDPKVSYKEFITTSFDIGKIEIKDDNTEITLGTFSDLCLRAAGYVAEQFPDRTALAVKNGLMTDKDKENSAITVERFIDILYTALNLPLCVIDSWDFNAATNTATPTLVVLDGGKNEDGTERDLLYRLKEFEDNDLPTTEQEEKDDSSDAADNAVVQGSSKDLTTAEKINELQKLKIIAETDNLRLNDNVSRAETAKILAIISGMDSSVVEPQNIFTDVTSAHWAFKYIEYDYAHGILEGDGGLFRPDDNVSYAEMCKLLVCSLGYGVYAENMGGYPNGYITQAVQLNLTEGLGGISVNDKLTREQIMLMTYNALDVPLVLVVGWEASETSDGLVYTPVLNIADGKDEREFASLRTRLTENE